MASGDPHNFGYGGCWCGGRHDTVTYSATDQITCTVLHLDGDGKQVPCPGFQTSSGQPVKPPIALDDAWARAEAALPDGWVIAGVWLSGHGEGRYQAMAQGPKRSQTVSGDSNKTSPADALMSLAAHLEERK